VSDGQINRLLHLLERIATALERANPPQPISAAQAQRIAETPIPTARQPFVVWSTSQMTAGSHDPV